MIYIKNYCSKTLLLAAKWDVPMLIDVDTNLMIASTSELEMKKFNGFLCFNKLETFEFTNFTKLKDTMR